MDSRVNPLSVFIQNDENSYSVHRCDGNSVTIDKLAPGTTYVVRVQAQTVESAGTYSMEYEFDTLPSGKDACRAGAMAVQPVWREVCAIPNTSLYVAFAFRTGRCEPNRHHWGSSRWGGLHRSSHRVCPLRTSDVSTPPPCLRCPQIIHSNLVQN